MVVTLSMGQMASALTDDWETARALAERAGFAGPLRTGPKALGGLVAKGYALRRETIPGNCRYEYRRA